MCRCYCDSRCCLLTDTCPHVFTYMFVKQRTTTTILVQRIEHCSSSIAHSRINMSTMTTTQTLVYLSQKITIYAGTALFFSGAIGSSLSIVIFLSLRTFRQNPSALYFIVMSFANIGNLINGLLVRILISGFAIDWTAISPFYCKFRWYCLQLCSLTSFTCTCLAAIDQYLATNARSRWRQWSHIRLARRWITFFVCLWLMHGVVFAIYFNLNVSPTTNKATCSIENNSVRQYHTYGYLIVLVGILPLLITPIFGLLARHNVQQSAYRTMPLVRRELDKQLTSMVLVQILHNAFATLPYTSLLSFSSIFGPINDQNLAAHIDFINVIAILLYYSCFTVGDFVRLSCDVHDRWLSSVRFFSSRLESVLHICLGIRTLSSTIDLRLVLHTSQTMSTQENDDQSYFTAYLTQSMTDIQ
jgi:hypothetical protein